MAANLAPINSEQLEAELLRACNVNHGIVLNACQLAYLIWGCQILLKLPNMNDLARTVVQDVARELAEAPVFEPQTRAMIERGW